ncbi:MAG: DUF308 domain-containing protein [Pseudolabrys sp.]
MLSNIQYIRRAFNVELHQHWALYLLEGVVLVVLGATAIVLPPLATLAITVLIGWLLLVSGIVGLITTFWMPAAPGFGWSLLSAVLAIVIGYLLLANLDLGTVFVTGVLVIFFIVEGFTSIMYARAHKREMSSSRWQWMMASGVIDLGLGAYILYGLPVIAPWALGLLVGINMVFGGIALIAMAERAHKEDRRTHRPA